MNVKLFCSSKNFFLLLLVSIIFSSCGKDASNEELIEQVKEEIEEEIEEVKEEEEPEEAKKVNWKMITLVIKNMDVTYDNDKTLKATMSPELIKEHVSIAEGIPETMSAWTDGRAKVTMDVKVIDDAITSLERYGKKSFWPGPYAVRDILDKYAPNGKYSSVFIALDMGSVPRNWDGLGYYPGPDLANGATYAVMSITHTSIFIHEWLHGAGGWYREKGFDVPDPHDNSKHGYPHTDDDWFKSLMNGRISRDGKPIGYTDEVWDYSGPSI